jgi:hypothetical protein
MLTPRGVVFWPVGTGDSTTIVVDDEIVMQVDLHDMDKADDDANPEVPVIDRLVEALPTGEDGRPYLAVFALTHADLDHCQRFEDLLSKLRTTCSFSAATRRTQSRCHAGSRRTR